jgi:hypothetical protein
LGAFFIHPKILSHIIYEYNRISLQTKAEIEEIWSLAPVIEAPLTIKQPFDIIYRHTSHQLRKAALVHESQREEILTHLSERCLRLQSFAVSCNVFQMCKWSADELSRILARVTDLRIGKLEPYWIPEGSSFCIWKDNVPKNAVLDAHNGILTYPSAADVHQMPHTMLAPMAPIAPTPKICEYITRNGVRCHCDRHRPLTNGW